MEKSKVNPKLTDLIPIYGAADYLIRETDYELNEERIPLIKKIGTKALLLGQIAYNAYLSTEVLNLIGGRPTLTQKILENILK